MEPPPYKAGSGSIFSLNHAYSIKVYAADHNISNIAHHARR